VGAIVRGQRNWGTREKMWTRQRQYKALLLLPTFRASHIMHDKYIKLIRTPFFSVKIEACDTVTASLCTIVFGLLTLTLPVNSPRCQTREPGVFAARRQSPTQAIVWQGETFQEPTSKEQTQAPIAGFWGSFPSFPNADPTFWTHVLVNPFPLPTLR